MKAIEKLKILKEKIETARKLNEDIAETRLAERNKINSLENKIKILKKGIKQNAEDLETFIKDLDENS